MADMRYAIPESRSQTSSAGALRCRAEFTRVSDDVVISTHSRGFYVLGPGRGLNHSSVTQAGSALDAALNVGQNELYQTKPQASEGPLEDRRTYQAPTASCSRMAGGDQLLGGVAAVSVKR